VDRIVLADDTWLDFEPGWLTATEAGRCLEALRAEVTWYRYRSVFSTCTRSTLRNCLSNCVRN